MGINWTPWFNVPMHRRLEVFSLGFMLFFPIFICPILAIFMIYLMIAGNIYWKIICGSYFVFYFSDIRSSVRGGRGAGYKWLRGMRIFKYIKDYFPIDLVKTADLTPDRNYLICIFPHGMFSVGAAINFATNHSKWSEYYPGLRSKLTSLNANYYFPLSRELFLSCGMVSASAESLTTVLKQSNDPNDKSNRDGYTSNAVGLIVGGMREQNFTQPDTYKLVVEKRRGFVRIALQTGASLVPAISFGENNLYRLLDCKRGSVASAIDKFLNKNTRHFPPLYSGRSFLQYDYGLIPRRHPITTVIGAPIHLAMNPNPNQMDLDEVHRIFCMQLHELFEAHKSTYIKNSDDVFLEFL